ncbi:hypothetical protein F4821DRAFT_238343 [Hypoxylon rubiginosum]|uniref:Uncharacterized protein n=1 Tax=Hypoxylon rubiginosum TaxID=110542 RepID=A0ACC0D1P8_9PEZI|nr:hypothetical protein F4821DRAFT_238343 [Hypoxylon rubiginosum]
MSATTDADEAEARYNEIANDPTETTLQPQEELLPSTSGGTLLPNPIASAVSFATRSTSFALRLGTFIGGYSLGAAKFTTLSSLELGRGILEGILSRAGRDVMSRAQSEFGRTDAESILEKSLESLHQTMSQIVFWTATGFHLTGTTVSTVSQISQLFLSVLDQFFGSTDSSRAIASIITLIRREFQNPATGVQGEKVGVMDLLLGLCGLAYLQNWCRKTIQDEARRLGQEEIIWDVVLLDDGERVDVDEEEALAARINEHGQDVSSSNQDNFLGAIEQHGAQWNGDDDDELPETQLKRQILRSLPKDAQVSITTSTTTTKTITVDIKGAPLMPVLSLPGVDLVKSEVTEDLPPDNPDANPNYKVVYKISRNKVRTTAVDSDAEDETRSHVEEIEDDGPESPINLDTSQLDQPPPVPPKAARPTFASAARERGNAMNDHPVRTLPSSTVSASLHSPKDRTFSSSSPKQVPEHAANQKRARKPLEETRHGYRDLPSAPISPTSNKTLGKKPGSPPAVKTSEKKSSIRSVLKKGSVPGFASLLNRDSSSENLQSGTGRKSTTKPPWGSNKPPQSKLPVTQRKAGFSDRSSGLIPNREPPRPPHRLSSNNFSSRDLGETGIGSSLPRSPSRASYVPLQDKRRDSMVSLTDTFSVHSFESRPSSPAFQRSELRNQSGLLHPETAPELGAQNSPSPPRGHKRARSENRSLYSPSIYTLKTRDSQMSLALSSFHQRSAYSDSEAVDTLRRTGMVDGMFPDFHILRNITRYSRYASAAYGSNFLKLMGITKELPSLKAVDETHRDVRSFAHHTELPPDSILLSSFVDPQGGSDSTGSTDTGIPLVHTIALDEESKAVVLSCRGTLGFEDVLADMMCEYDDLFWRGKSYKVHKGIHASARRLLYGGDGRVLATLKEALEEFPDYGLVLCGHSLGGAVTALLGAMLSEPATSGTAFVTSAEPHHRLLPDGNNRGVSHICLPSGRPIHVYAYGPPATMSPSLQKATRGLITSTVYGNDLVPYLSLGVLHDFQAVALAFKTDNSEAKAEVRRRIWEGLQSGLADKWYNNGPTHRASEEEDKWAYAALKTLRASMMSSKLLPPGEVFSVESTPALRRDAFLQAGTGQVGRPATRIVFKYVRDVETGFREVRFGASMLLDHSPGRYEDALRRLTLGVV